jgi:hypothetical protein
MGAIFDLQRLVGNAVFSAQTLSGAASAPGASLTGTGTLTPGSAQGQGNASTPGANLSGAGSIAPGGAAGSVNATAPGAALNGTGNVAPGTANGTSNAAAPGVNLAGTGNLSPGNATGVLPPGTAPGTALSGSGALSSGGATGSGASAIRDLLADLIDGVTLTPAKTSRAIDAAIQQYTKDRPRTVPEDVALATAQVLPALSAWDAELSEVVSIEVPIDLIPIEYLDSADYFVRSTPTGDAICLLDARTAGEMVRVRYTAPHTLSTVPVKDAEAVACWAAAFIADQLAAKYSNSSQPTIAADSADVAHPAREWAARARGWRQRYGALLGVAGVSGASSDKPITKPAGTVVEFDLADVRQRPTLYPRGRRR